MCSEREEKTEKPPETKTPKASASKASVVFATETLGQSIGPSPAVPTSTRTCAPAGQAKESVPPVLPTPGKIGRYEVRQLLAQGGFGAVYVGHDADLDRQVAIKVPLPGITEGQREKFLQEARRLAQLRHPGIVTVHDVGVDAGQCYIVTDFLQGMTLHHWLDQHTPTWQEAARITIAVAEALAYAHARRTVHRDVKPGNIILIEGLIPVLVDFGLGISEADVSGAERGRVAGTVPYMSPEQVCGASHRIDGRTDVYSLGVVLYRMLCGRLPFTARDPRELLRQIVYDDPQPPRQLVPSVPRQLEAICLRALAKEQNARYTTAGDMAEDLRQLLVAAWAEDITVPPTSSGIPSQRYNSASAAGLTAAVPSSVRQLGESQIREVTLLYGKSELRGADSDTSVHPEKQNKLVQKSYALCIETIRRFGGTRLPTEDEELLVCFGYPEAHEDAPQRAVRAGLAILHELELRNRQHGAELSMWFTIHTGLAVVGETLGYPGMISLTGEANLVASRLESVARPGTVLVSQATYLLIQGFFHCESLGAHALKGVLEPVVVFRVLHEG
jgi:serine/threonine protein kinase